MYICVYVYIYIYIYRCLYIYMSIHKYRYRNPLLSMLTGCLAAVTGWPTGWLAAGWPAQPSKNLGFRPRCFFNFFIFFNFLKNFNYRAMFLSPTKTFTTKRLQIWEMFSSPTKAFTTKSPQIRETASPNRSCVLSGSSTRTWPSHHHGCWLASPAIQESGISA